MRIRAIIVILSLGVTSGLVPRHAAGGDSEQDQTKQSYLVLYRPGPAWLAGKPVSEQPLRTHGKYMLDLYIGGSMKLAGPLGDDAGGAVMLTAADRAEAIAIVEADPAVVSGIFVYELHAWKVQPWDEFARRAREAASAAASGATSSQAAPGSARD